MATLLEVQQKLKVPKEHKNNFGNYPYRNASDILEEVKKYTSEAIRLSDELVLIGDRYYVKATACYGDTCVTAYAREPLTKKGSDESQITGATSTYARKYALQGLFAIDDSANDPDSVESKPVVESNVIETSREFKENILNSFKSVKTKDHIITMASGIKAGEGILVKSDLLELKGTLVAKGEEVGLKKSEVAEIYKETE